MRCFAHPREYLGEAFDPFSDEVKASSLSANEYTQALTILSMHEGEWTLNIEESSCRGREGASHIKTRNLVSDADITLPRRGLVEVNSGELMDEQQKSSFSAQSRWWYVKKEGFWFADKGVNNVTSPQWRVELVSVTGDEIRFLRRARIGQQSKRRYLALYSLRKFRKQLYIEELVFFNNSLSHKTRWLLSR